MAISVVSFSFSRAAQPDARGLCSLLDDGFLYRILSLTHLISNSGGPEGPFCRVVAFSTTSSPTHLISNLIGGPRAPSAGWWLSLPHLVSNSLISNSIGGPEGPFCWVVAFPTTSSLQLVSPLTHWLPVPTELYNSSIAYSISLEWHVWSSSSGNNFYAVQRSLSSGASVYDCTMGFLPCPIFFSQARLRDFFSQLPSECVTSFRCITLEWHDWSGRRSIYNNILYVISSRVIFLFIFCRLFNSRQIYLTPKWDLNRYCKSGWE